MAPALDSLPAGARVLVIRLRSLGDCVLTTPALRLLNAFRPDLEIAVAVEPRFSAVFASHPAVAAVLEPSLAAARRWRPRLALNFHGGTRSLWLTLASGAPLRAGFGHFRHQWAYNIRIPRAQEILAEERTVHTAEHLASAMFYLGVPRSPIPRAELFAPPPAPRPPYAVLHPFASAPEKAWPPERFAALGRHLRDSHGLGVIVIGGAADDFRPFAEFESLRGAPLAEVMQLVRGASLFAGNDSGPAHIAAAFGVPSLVLFGPSDPRIWGPWQAPAEVLRAPEGIARIPLEDALEAAERLRARAW
ncbi:MAG: glycosyltransferase family 9 protein [Bryobacteraceae bacterium]|nr:glycosyltransferase family 9 protein [Bryobacteraceae bacterium]